MNRFLVLVLAGLAATAVAAAPTVAGGGGGKTWRVTVENLTPAGSQPLSPPLLAVHSKRADVWSVGQIANHGVAAIAEDANNEPLESALKKLPGVMSAATGIDEGAADPAPIPPGASQTFIITSKGKFNRLSLVSMLVNTNDAFTGLDARLLRGRSQTLLVRAYDGGSEENTEKKSDIPGPCCNNPFVRVPEGDLIRMHPGISGAGDLDATVYGWTGPVAKITIERVS